jgi:hypothetical protein
MLFPAPLGLIYIPSLLVVQGDAVATANNIIASESLFRIGMVINLFSPILMILVVLALYQLLKFVNKSMALLMIMFVLVGAPIAMLAELNQLAVLQLLSDADYLSVFTTAQVNALVMFFLDLHRLGVLIAHIFWGLWLFPLGYLVFKSGFLPKIPGVLLIIGCFGYVIQSFAAFLVPKLQVNIIFFTSWGELVFPLWLVVKGVNPERWKKRISESA